LRAAARCEANASATQTTASRSAPPKTSAVPATMR
jgi:hypothetical protein